MVEFKRQKKTFHRYFHDGVGGPPESLRQAIAYRDEQISVHEYREKEAKAMALVARKEAVARVLKQRRQRLLTGVLAGPSGRPVTRARRRTRKAPPEGDPSA
jgi:hypothetical protein